MTKLLQGLRRYETNLRPRYARSFAALADRQAPHALFLGCSDSRVVPDLVTATTPGELFVVRNVAALAPPVSSGTPNAVHAAVSYALDVLGVRDIIVCGHSNCGGIRAALEAGALEASTAGWLGSVRPALEAWRRHGPMDPALSEPDQLSQWSTRMQLDHLRSYEPVRRHLRDGGLRLHAFWFHIADGRMLAFDERRGRYRPAHEVLGEQESAAYLSETSPSPMI